MKHAFTQKELAEFVKEGRTIMIGFREAANIFWSHGTAEYYVSSSSFYKTTGGMPLLRKGRRMAVTPEYFEKIKNACEIEKGI